MPSTPINVNTITTAHLITAPASPGFVRVLNYLLVAGGTTNVTLQDTSGTAATGPFPLSATCGEVEMVDREGCFDLAVGKGLDLVNSAAVQVSGHLKYEIKGI
jgi:hypothetical protein